jgi:hypothetical protein
VTSEEREAYQRELRAAAKRLGLPAHGNLETALLRHATEAIAALSSKCTPGNLSELLEHAATSLGLEIVDVHDDHDLKSLLERIPPTREPALARVRMELDDKTDAVVLQRQNPEPWERRYLAVINCRSWHAHRRYFSKWHELVHLLLEGRQLRLEFRRTGVERKHPEEILVDKIAGELAFYPPIFVPIMLVELGEDRRLTFAAIDRVRQRVAPEASWHATLLAAVRHSPQPIYAVRAQLGLKKSEERQAKDLLSGVTEPPAAKLRVKEARANAAAEALGIRVHFNMEVPVESVAVKAFDGPSGTIHSGREDLGLWRTSGGPVGQGPLSVEAVRRGDDVWCLLHLTSSTAGVMAHRQNTSARTKSTKVTPPKPLWGDEQD